MTEMEVEEGILEDEDDGTNASSEDDNSDDDDDDSSDSSSDENDDDDEFDDTVIRIPIQDSDEFVVFSTDELPDDEADVVELLRGEVAPLKIWNKVSLAYYRAHKQDKFAKILNEICDNNDEDDAANLALRYPENVDNNWEKVKMLNILAAYHYQQAGDMTQVADNDDDEQQTKHEETHMKLAMDLIKKASLIDSNNSDLHSITFVNKAMLHFRRYTTKRDAPDAQEQLEEAQKQIRNALHSLAKPLARGVEVEWTHPAPGGSHYIVSRAYISSEVDGDAPVDLTLVGDPDDNDTPPNSVKGVSPKFLRAVTDLTGERASLLITAYLVSACLKFEAGEYKEAENIYKRVIIEDPGCPAAVRVALGMCFYKRGRIQRAKMAFQRAIDLDERNEEALVALAIIERKQGRAGLAKERQKNDSDKDYLNQLEKDMNRRVMDKFQRVYSIGTDRMDALETKFRHPVAVNNIARHRYLRLLWKEVGLGDDTATVRLTSDSDVVEVEGNFDFREALKDANVIKIGDAIYRVDRSKGRAVTRRKIPIVRAYRGPNQHGQKISVTNFEEAQNIMRENNFSLIAADRNGDHQVVGEGYHIEAVAHHAQGNMKQAREYYLQAHARKHVRSYFGLAQTHMHFRDYDRALAVLVELNRRVSNMEEVLLRIGILYLLKREYKDATKHLDRVVELNPANYFAWIGLAEVHQMKPTFAGKLQAREAYQKAEEAWRDQGKPSAALYNNIGVLMFHLHKRNRASRGLLEAQQYFCKALKRHQPRLNLEFSMPADCFENKELVLPVFNLARLKEEQGLYEQAKSMYGRILKKHKNFVECHLRQSVILLNANEHEAAAEELHEAKRKCDSWVFSGSSQAPIAQLRKWALRRSDTLTMLGLLQMKTGELEEAKKTFTKIRESFLKNIPDGWAWGSQGLKKKVIARDTYCVVALGNICYEQSNGEVDFYMRKIKESKDFFMSVINHIDIGNLFAANGLGLIWADECKFAAAKTLFKEIREGSSGLIPDVWINLGHMYLYNKQPLLAIDLYTKCMNEFFDGQEPELLLYIANALFVSAMAAHAEAKAAHDRASDGVARTAKAVVISAANQFTDCINTLSKLLQLTPDNLHVWYCLAVTLDEFGVSAEYRKAPSLVKDIEHYEEAVGAFLRAEKLYAWLDNQDTDEVNAKLGAPKDRLENCVDNRQRSQATLKELRESYADQQGKLEEEKARHLEHMESERLAKEQAKAEAEARKQQEQERAQLVADKMKQNVKMWSEDAVVQEELQKSQKGKRRKKKPRAERKAERVEKSASSSEDSPSEDAVNDLFTDSSDDGGGGSNEEDPARTSGRLKKKSGDSDSDGNSDDEAAPAGAADDSDDSDAGGARKRRRKAVIDESSDSEPGDTMAALFDDSDSDSDVNDAPPAKAPQQTEEAASASQEDPAKAVKGGDGIDGGDGVDGDSEPGDTMAALFDDSDSDSDVNDAPPTKAPQQTEEAVSASQEDPAKAVKGSDGIDGGDGVDGDDEDEEENDHQNDHVDGGDAVAAVDGGDAVAAVDGGDASSADKEDEEENDHQNPDSRRDDGGGGGGDGVGTDGDDDVDDDVDDDGGDGLRTAPVKRPLSDNDSSDNGEEHRHKRKRIEEKA